MARVGKALVVVQFTAGANVASRALALEGAHGVKALSAMLTGVGTYKKTKSSLSRLYFVQSRVCAQNIVLKTKLQCVLCLRFEIL